MISLVLEDGEGSGVKAAVTSDHLVKVTTVPSRSADWTPEQLTRFKLFRALFTNSGGTSEMAVDGSSTPEVFACRASEGRVRFIKAVRLVLKGANLDINTQDARRFGSATAVSTPLPNGVEFVVVHDGEDVPIFPSAVMELVGFLDSANQLVTIPNSIGSQLDFISFDYVFGKPITLPEGSQDRIEIRINDDLTNLVSFQAHIIDAYQEFL